MTYKVTEPDGTELLFETDDLIELIDQYEMAACIVAYCPDADGYTLEWEQTK